MPARGLTVLTGETGAGKTALLSALKLLMGARADKDAVRDGEEALVVSGRFYGVAAPTGLDEDARDARGRPSRRAGRHAPRHRGRPLARLPRRPHGERRRACPRRGAHHRPLRSARAPAAHEDIPARAHARRVGGRGRGRGARRLRGGVHGRGCGGGRARARARGGRGLVGQARRGALRAAAHRRGRPARGRVRRAAGRARARGACRGACGRRERGTRGACGRGGRHRRAGRRGARRSIRAARYDAKLGEFADALREAGYVLEDMARETRDYREGVEFDPEALAQQQERMASLQGLLRTYGPRMEDVLARRAEAADLVSLVDDAAERERAAQQELDRAEEALAQAACRAGRGARRGRAAVRRGRDVRRWAAWKWAAPQLVWRPCAARARAVDEGGSAGGGVPVPAWRRDAGAPARAHRIGRRGQPRHAGREGGAGRGRRGGHACVRRRWTPAWEARPPWRWPTCWPIWRARTR